MKIAVVGLGKIGLPLAVQFATKGHTVLGVDIDTTTVEAINQSREPFPGEFGLAEALLSVVSSGLLKATTSYEESIPQADAVVVVVPLFVDNEAQPDFGSMDSASSSIAASLAEGTLVIYETTLPIGTTRNRWKPLLEKLSGLQEGIDFHLVFSPERVLTGRVFEDLRKYPKLVGGLSADGASRALQFYNEVLDFDERFDLPRPNGVWDMGSAEAAEMAKLAETTYRDVNIGLANQFALHAEEIGVDVYRVIEACNSQPYSHIHSPGISVGGHCIPVYPLLYLATDHNSAVVGAARKLNSRMPSEIVSRLCKVAGSISGRKIVILGLSYRAGVKEDAYSGLYPTLEILESKGAQVSVTDPLYSDDELRDKGLRPHTPGEAAFAVLLHTSHKEFLDLSERDFPGVEVVVDGRNFLDNASWESATFVRFGKP